MSKQPKNSDENEIDLAELRKKMGNAASNFNARLFQLLRFGIKNAIILIVLLIVGVGLGFYLDKTQKTYDHLLVVSPNFGSVDYLYEKVDLIESKIKENDTVFLKGLGIQNAKKLAKIEIEPIVDIYQFANRNETYLEMLKVMAENSDIRKIVEEPLTSKNYPQHLITFSTKDATDTKKTVEPLLKYLNDSDFYRKIQTEYVKNVAYKMSANDSTIKRIDKLLDALASKNSGSGQVYINQNTQLNDVLETKDRLVREQGDHRIDMVSIDKIVKDNNTILNIENTKAVNGKLKIVLPLLFIFLFIAIKLFLSFYRKQSAKMNQA
ncbi:MAG: hypothetical protein EOO50_03610 [Flavobacterium sp.]|uniref:hypothetical protein n=1 Tax=Flavobacterium sp. TaxID=239 RepID=UPI0012051712|nr:hypothetical protein [Flavobacterium sp.]RZJ67921.1 MAG: hypothetical protein EOO50_03610 [Flavobacterium sp.]